MKKGKVIKWSQKLVDVAKIKPTPKNYKIKTDLGAKRLQSSLDKFGLAGSVVCNTDMFLIDGNSRLEEAKKNKEKKIWVSLPNIKLTPKQFEEMSAMYDFAKAGEVDLERINKDLGKTKDFFDQWNLEVPMVLLNNMGSKAAVEKTLPNEKSSKVKKEKVIESVMLVQLFFTPKEEGEFRKLEDKLMKKFKAESTTQLVLKVYKSIK